VVLETILERDAVSFENERLDLADLVLVGVITGVWPRFERDVTRGLVLERDARGAVGAAELRARATEFRYARRLLSASEFSSWLAARSLTVADLSGGLGRALVRERAADGDGRGDVAVAELAAALYVDAICNGIFETLASAAIGRMAAAHRLGRLGAELADGRVEATLADAIECRASGVAALGEVELAARLRRLWAYEDARAVVREQVAEPVSLRRRLADHGLEWLRIEGWRLSFAGEDAAREARALIRDDGLGADQVGTIAGTAAVAVSFYLDQVPDQVAVSLAATAPGEVAVPWLADEEWHVLVVGTKTAPSVEDPVLRERATDELLADVLRRQAAGRARLIGVF
jgi:hypothetical protein